MQLGLWEDNQDTHFGLKWPKEQIFFSEYRTHTQTNAQEVNFGAKVRDFEKALDTCMPQRRKLMLYR